MFFGVVDLAAVAGVDFQGVHFFLLVVEVLVFAEEFELFVGFFHPLLPLGVVIEYFVDAVGVARLDLGFGLLLDGGVGVLRRLLFLLFLFLSIGLFCFLFSEF